MSTIERALEKQRQAELHKQQSQQQAVLEQHPPSGAESRVADDAAAPFSLQPESVVTQSDASQRLTTAPPPPASLKSTNHYQPPSEDLTQAAEKSSHGDNPLSVNIDIQRLEALGMVTPTENFTQIKEEYRYIKRPLLNNAFGPGASTLNQPNLVMVSSSFSGEGKTFTTVNLAISMTLEEDRKVLLVDADVIKPHVCERLGIPEQAGLMDYLTGKAEVSDIILNTNIPNLKLITAGRRHHHSNEMIASDKMKLFMKELSVRYPDRIVIFDTSPLLGASETNVLAQMTGQAVVVVEEERTTHPQLQQALSLLDPNMAVGLVLNKSNSRRREYYGYYYASS